MSNALKITWDEPVFHRWEQGDEVLTQLFDLAQRKHWHIMLPYRLLGDRKEQGLFGAWYEYHDALRKEADWYLKVLQREMYPEECWMQGVDFQREVLDFANLTWRGRSSGIFVTDNPAFFEHRYALEHRVRSLGYPRWSTLLIHTPESALEELRDGWPRGHREYGYNTIWRATGFSHEREHLAERIEILRQVISECERFLDYADRITMIWSDGGLGATEGAEFTGGGNTSDGRDSFYGRQVRIGLAEGAFSLWWSANDLITKRDREDICEHDWGGSLEYLWENAKQERVRQTSHRIRWPARRRSKRDQKVVTEQEGDALKFYTARLAITDSAILEFRLFLSALKDAVERYQIAGDGDDDAS